MAHRLLRLFFGCAILGLSLGGSGNAQQPVPPEPAPDNPDPESAIAGQRAPVRTPAPLISGPPALNTQNAVWVAVGPGPTINGQGENVSPDNEVAGAIHTVLPHPSNPNIMYIGAVNGGVWKTVNATAAKPSWTPLTDALSSMSIGAMEFDPADPNRIIVGIGRFGSYGRVGGALTGIQITSDGGSSWTEISPSLLQGRNIAGVAVRGNTMMAAANPFGSGGGLYRSTDNGSNWVFVSGSSGLPTGGIHDLVGDPNRLTRFYAAVQADGIYMSDDTGATWTKISSNDTTSTGVQAILNANGAANNNTEMAVAPNGRLFAMVMTNGQPGAVGYADNNGLTWGAMDLPRTQESDGDIEGLSPREKPGGQGAIHSSIAADPTDSNIVYIGGDRQDTPFPNFIGARNFSGRIFRGNASIGATGAVPSPQWAHMTHSNNIVAIPNGGTASASSPHADSREMAFDAQGHLIETDDGGIYRRTLPRSNLGDWFSINGNLQVAEYHDIAYDPISGVVNGGAQDAGTQRQINPGQPTFDSVSTGDGADVEIDYVSVPGRSILYSSAQNLGGFARRTYDSANSLTDVAFLAQNGSSVSAQFNTPVKLNRIDPTRLVIGGALHVHESFDQGDNLVQVTLGTGVPYFSGKPLVYGGYLSGAPNTNVLWVGSGASVFVRTNAGNTLTATPTTFPGGSVRSIDIAPDDWRVAYVCDSDQVWVTTDIGVTWTEITGTLATLGTDDFHKLLVAGTTGGDAIFLACRQGVFVADASAPTAWSGLNGGMPNAPVWDLDYYPADDVLVAGTMGRGAWRLNSVAGGPDIGVLGNGSGILSGSQAAIPGNGTDFGSVNIDSTIRTQTFTITNTGVDNLTITLPLAISGSSDFIIAANPQTSIAASGSTTFMVAFDPGSVGTVSATVSIANNDANENPFTFVVQGTGQEFPDMSVLGNGFVIATNDLLPSVTDNTDFGSANILGGAVTNSFVISNSGRTNLSVTLPVTFSGPAAGDFTVVIAPANNVAAGGSTTFSARFIPGALGARDATMSIGNNDPDSNPYTFAIRGRGAALPEIGVIGNGVNITDGDPTPTPVDNTEFGGTDIASGTITHSFFITNSGSASLNVFLPITFSGLHASDFTVTTPPPTTVATGAFASFAVTFDPGGAGQRDTVMSIANSDSDEGSFDIALRGTGTLEPEIAVTGNGIAIGDGDTFTSILNGTDFGDAILGVDTVSRTFVITNGGSSNVTLNLPVNITGSGSADFSVTTIPGNIIPPGTATPLEITFSPTVIGTRTATISFGNNDADENPYNFAVAGNATEAEIAVFGNSLLIADGDTTPRTADHTDFGTADVTAESVTRTFVITNSGDALLTVVLPLAITGPAAADFQLTSIPSTTISPAGTSAFQITFNPVGTGPRNATVSFGNTDANENPYDFAITGTGTGPDIEIIGGLATIADGETNTVFTNRTDFGTNTVASGATTNTFVIRNAGAGTLRLTPPITIEGAAAADFTVSRQPGTNALIAGATTTFDVVFRPLTGGPRVAAVNVVSLDADENPYDFAISGLGFGPEVSLLGNGLVITNGANVPSILDGTSFGGADLNSGALIRQYTITNEGTTNLNLTLPITFSGTAAADYSIIANPPVSIAAGASRTFQVSFDPSQAGLRSAFVILNSDDADESVFGFAVEGVGIVVPPTITAQPAGKNLNALQSTTLFIGANGTLPLTYQWFKDGTPIAGATRPTLVRNKLTTANGGVYHATVSNVAGTATSSSAQLTVNLLPTVTSWPGPAPIVYGTLLGSAQLNAVASVPGSFAYAPAASARLDAGLGQVLAVTFTPDNPLVYGSSAAAVTIDVSPAALTLHATDQSRLVNTANPTLSFTGTGFVVPDNESSLDSAPSIATTATPGSPVGDYPIALTGGADVNYAISRVDGTLHVFAEAPAIVQQPTDLTVEALSDATLTVAATGLPTLAYQWKKDGVDIPGANSATLALTAVTPNSAGAYSVAVVNGQGTVTSTPATLTVNRLNPIITWATPANVPYGTALDASQLNATANVAGAFDYSANPAGTVPNAGPLVVRATFTPADTLNYNGVAPSVNLMVDNAILTVGVENVTREFGAANPAFVVTYAGFVNGDTTASLAASATPSTTATAASLPGSYPLTAAGAAGPNYDFNYVAGNLTVFATPPAITTEPASASVTLGAATNFSVVATGTAPLSYQWRLAGSDLPGASAATFSIGASTLADAGSYDVIVSNVGGSVTSVVANLTVLVPPAIVVSPASVNVDARGIATFSVNATGSAPLRYQWTKDGSDLSGQTNPTLLLSNIAAGDAGSYRVVVSNAAGTATSAAATLTVNLIAPTVTWSTPAPIGYGNPLGESQLSAAASVAGSFTYTPASGTVLAGGSQPLSVLFTPLDAGRYAPVTVNRSITVQPVPLTVTANNGSREIGVPNPVFTVSYSGFVNGDDASSLTIVPTANSAADAASPVGNYLISATGGVSSSYTFSYVPGTLTVVAVPVSITQQPLSLVVNQAHTANFTVVAAGSPVLSYQWRRAGTNLIGENAATLSVSDAQAADDSTYDVIVSNPANSVTSSVVTLDVLLPSTISWPNPADISYGTALGANEFNATASVPGTITYGQVAGSVLAAGSYVLALNFAPDDTAVYLPTNAMVNLTVDPAPLTVTGDSLSREYGAANPALTISFAGFVNGDDETVLSGQPTAVTAADAASIPGNYPITVSGAAGANYTVTHVAGNLSVFANAPAVTSPPSSLTVTNGDSAAFAATVTGTLPLSFQWRKDGVDLPGESTSALSVPGAQLGDAGAYDLVVSNIGGSVTSAVATLTVVVPPALTLQPVSQVFNALNDVTFSVAATGTAPLNYQWSRNGQAIPDATNSSLTLVGVTPAAVGAYSATVFNVAGTVTSDTATLSVNELAPDITWAIPQQVSYGTPLSSAQLNASTFIPGTFIYTPAPGTVLASGSHTLNVVFTPEDTTNFVATNALVQLTVNKSPLSVIANNLSREYSTPNPTLTVAYSGFVNGEDSTALATPPTLATVADGTSLPGNYPITASGAAAANYVITHTDGNLTVFANAPNITVDPVSLTTISTLNASFDVQATGTAPITYQWRHQGTNLPNETNPNLTINAVDPFRDAGAYDVVLANIAGSRTSLVATLTVLVTPAITQQPVDVTANALGTAAFSVSATGTAPLRYQWRKDGVTILNATNANLVFSTVRTNDAGTYTASVANGAGSFTSTAATLSVNQLASVLTWPTPPPISYGTAVGSGQLNATANTPGIFTYSPVIGSILPAGSHTLAVDFIPDDSANYRPASGTVDLQVNSALLTVAAVSKSREFGRANPTLDVTYTGFVNGENENILSRLPALSTTADSASILGDYPITVAGATAPNYSVNHVAGTLTVFGLSPVIQTHPVDRITVAGTDVSFTNAATGTAPLGFQWRKGGIAIGDATNAIFSITNVQLLDSGGYDVVVSNIAGSTVSFPAVLNVLVPPQFVLPPSNTTVAVGQPMVLTSAAIGTAPLGYQWFQDNVALPGRTNANLVFNSPGTGDAGDYHVVATNAAGTATGQVATVTINQSPAIQQAPANSSVNPGQPLILVAQAFGQGTLTYVWSRAGTNIQSSTTNTLVITNANLGEVGLYEVLVTNNFGQAQSQEFLVTLEGAPQIVTQPTDRAAMPGTDVTFAVLASGSQPLQYAWLKDGLALPAATGRTLSVTNIALGDAGLYSVAVANAFGVAVSVPASLSIIGPPLISVNPTNRIGALGGTLDLVVQVESAIPPAYQWRHDDQLITNATNGTLTLSGLQSTDSGVYDVIVTNVAGSLTSSVATVTVMQPPAFVQQPAGLTLTIGQNATLATLANGTAPLGFQWMRDGLDIPGATTNLLQLTDVQRVNEGNYAVRISNPVGTIFSQSASLRVLSPQILTNFSGGRRDQFRLHFGDESGGLLNPADARRFVIEESTDLVNWSILSTNGAGLSLTNGQFRFEDLGSVILSRRFYRVREQ